MDSPRNILSQARNLLEREYTIIRGYDGGIHLLPRNALRVTCDTNTLDDAEGIMSFLVEFAPDTYMWLEATPVEGLKQALFDEDFETLSRLFNVKLRSCEGRVDLEFDSEVTNAKGIPFSWCTIELTADTWSAMRAAMLKADWNN
jgi:hypothetical protein